MKLLRFMVATSTTLLEKIQAFPAEHFMLMRMALLLLAAALLAFGVWTFSTPDGFPPSERRLSAFQGGH